MVGIRLQFSSLSFPVFFPGKKSNPMSLQNVRWHWNLTVVTKMWASLVAHTAKNLPPVWEIRVQSLGQENPLEKGMATHFSILAWRIPWTEESMVLQRAGHDQVTNVFTSLREKKQNTSESLCVETHVDREWLPWIRGYRWLLSPSFLPIF